MFQTKYIENNVTMYPGIHLFCGFVYIETACHSVAQAVPELTL